MPESKKITKRVVRHQALRDERYSMKKEGIIKKSKFMEPHVQNHEGFIYLAEEHEAEER